MAREPNAATVETKRRQEGGLSWHRSNEEGYLSRCLGRHHRLEHGARTDQSGLHPARSRGFHTPFLCFGVFLAQPTKKNAAANLQHRTCVSDENKMSGVPVTSKTMAVTAVQQTYCRCCDIVVKAQPAGRRQTLCGKTSTTSTRVYQNTSNANIFPGLTSAVTQKRRAHDGS